MKIDLSNRHPAIQSLRLTRLAAGALTENARGRMTDFIRRGFRGGLNADRAGNPDLYYTSFALAVLVALDGSPPDLGMTVKALDAFGDGDGLDNVHLCALARCRMAIKHLRPPKSPRSRMNVATMVKTRQPECSIKSRIESLLSSAPSIYDAFLAWLALDALGTRPKFSMVGDLPDDAPATVVAAAVCMSGSAAAKLAERLEQHRRGGGFAAGRDLAMPDMLSTSAAIFSLRLAGLPMIAADSAVIEFIEAHRGMNGGFFASMADMTDDAEYSFYALLALGSILAGA